MYEHLWMCVYPEKDTFRKRQRKLFKYTNEILILNEGTTPHMGMEVYSGRTASNHLGNTSTARVDDSLFCN